jgi:dethiobiotin synthetase
MNLFITGTDTGVGKTYVTALLIRHLRARGKDAVGFKPICCGSREDAEILHAAAGGQPLLNEVNPVWFRVPAAPYTASLIENRVVDLALIRDVYATLRSRHEIVLVEGVGGWLVPILRDYTVADLSAEFGLPVLVVVRNRLGALNHTALTVRQIRLTGQNCIGLVLNQGCSTTSEVTEADSADTVATTTNRSVLENWLDVPIVAEVATNQPSLDGWRDNCVMF